MSNLLLNVMEAFAQFERKLIRERQRRGLRSQGGKGSTPAGNRLLRPRARPSCGDESPMATRRLRLLVSSASAGTRYIGTFRSKSAGLGSLENELYAWNRGRETMSESEMQAELERLRAVNAQLKSKGKGGLTLKVNEKGGLSLYGMGRFPSRIRISRLFFSSEPILIAKASRLLGPANGTW